MSMTLEEWTEQISVAAQKAAPLAGSEAFIQVGKGFRLDPVFIGERIEKLKKELHEARVEIARGRKNRK